MELDLDAIEAAEKAMTPRPWTVVASSDGANSLRIFGEAFFIGIVGGSDDGVSVIAANADGIAILRNAAPDLTRRIREQDAELARWKDQWSVMARACGNWRTWPGEAEDDHDHSDWLAASRAIIERDELIAEIERLRALCGDAADVVDDDLECRPPRHALGSLYCRLRAASKGEQ